METRAAALARIFARRRRLPDLAGLPVWAGAPAAEIGRGVLLPVTFAGGSASVTAPETLVARVLASLDPSAAQAAPGWAALLLELALSDTLDRLADAFPALALVSGGEGPAGDAVAAFFEAGGETVRLDLSPGAADAVAAALADLPAERRPMPDLSVPISVRAHHATVTLDAWRAAAVGDVVLVPSRACGELTLVAGERFLWHAREEDGRVHVHSARHRPTDAEWEDHFLQDDAAPDAGLDDLPIRLAFEIGRIDVPLAELEALGPGHVFELGRAEADAVDIVANGRRIGAGRVVLVGESAGVQITRLGPR